MKTNERHISTVLFVFSLCFFSFAYGLTAGVYSLFPTTEIQEANALLDSILDPETTARHYPSVDHELKESIRHLDGASPGVNLVTGIGPNDQITAQILDMQGEVIHEWPIDWFNIWPDNGQLDYGQSTPQSRPGTEVHGAAVMENGDLVFLFSYLGVVRMAPDGSVVWKVPCQAHHSVYVHDDGNIWVGSRKKRNENQQATPFFSEHFEDTVLKISPEGKILDEFSVFDLLRDNNLEGMLYVGSRSNEEPVVRGDLLHLNDVEFFPSTLAPDFFQPGDVMLSLRNINTIIVVKLETQKVKFLCAGAFVRQHDPDFINGRTISVYDNNNVGRIEHGVQSRILKIDAPTNEVEVVFEGNSDVPFFSNIMGKHQWLPNGNLLVTESMQGRAIELTPEGKLAWEYINYVDDNRVGLVSEVTRLPMSYAKTFAKE